MGMGEDELSAEESRHIEDVRSQASQIVEFISGLQMAWNHGPKAVSILDDVKSSLQAVAERPS